MTLEEVKGFLESSLKDTSSDEKSAEYGTAVAKYLNDEGINVDILDVIIKGMDIDHGINFYTYLEKAQKKDLQRSWRIIDKSELCDRPTENSFKFLYGFLYRGLVGNNKIKSMLDLVIIKICDLLSSKEKIPLMIYGPSFIDYVVNDFPEKEVLPRWEEITVNSGIKMDFCQIFLNVITTLDAPFEKQHKFKTWLKEGKSIAEKEAIEAKIPESKVNDLHNLAIHYQKVEQDLHDYILKEADLEKTISEKEERIESLEGEKKELEQQVKASSDTVAVLQKELEESKKKIEQQKQMYEVQIRYINKGQEDLLQDISDAVKLEYRDFEKVKDRPVTGNMGEIYKAKLNNVFKILERKGIKVKS